MAPKKGVSIEDYKRLAAEGYSKTETARLLGVTTPTVFAVARKHNIIFPMGYIKKEKRDASVAKTEA